MAYWENQREDGDDPDAGGRDPDWENPDPADVDGNDDPALAPCPYCGKELSEDAELCSGCGSYIVPDEAPGRRPRWLLAGVVVCSLIVLLWIAL